MAMWPCLLSHVVFFPYRLVFVFICTFYILHIVYDVGKSRYMICSDLFIVVCRAKMSFFAIAAAAAHLFVLKQAIH